MDDLDTLKEGGTDEDSSCDGGFSANPIVGADELRVSLKKSVFTVLITSALPRRGLLSQGLKHEGELPPL